MGVSEDAVRRKAAAAGLAVSGLGEHALGGADRGGGGVVLSYATPPDHDYSRAIARLCAVLADLGR
jgi:GntR family transcriptional regulator/MocR family aminotransferase